MVAELCAGAQAGADEIGFDTALSTVQPGGHFFDAPQTMARYQTEFYQPVVHSYANFGTWTERGAEDTSARATGIWKSIVEAGPGITPDAARVAAMQDFIAKRSARRRRAPES